MKVAEGRGGGGEWSEEGGSSLLHGHGRRRRQFSGHFPIDLRDAASIAGVEGVSAAGGIYWRDSETRGERWLDECGAVEERRRACAGVELGLCAFGSSPVALSSGPNY